MCEKERERCVNVYRKERIDKCVLSVSEKEEKDTIRERLRGREREREAAP